MSKILYAASNMAHINNFHIPYITALRNDGHNVLVMASGDGADFNIPFEKRIFSRKNAECRKVIRDIIEAERFDAILLNTSLAAYHIRRALMRKERPRVVNFVHGYLFDREHKSFRDRLMLMAERSLRSVTDRVLVMNHDDMLIARKNALSLEEPIMTLGMGATVAPEQIDRGTVRSELIDDDKLVMTFVGELSARKNQEFLIRALRDVRWVHPNAVLWLVGEGNERESLLELCKMLGVSDFVRFLGRRDNPCDFIRASDLYVSAAKNEGMPFNIIEALGCGVPIIASDIKGHRDLLGGGEGVLYPYGSIQDFVDAVTDAVKCPDDKSEKKFEVYRRYSFDNVFPLTYKAIKEALFCE